MFMLSVRSIMCRIRAKGWFSLCKSVLDNRAAELGVAC